ncbi:MAG: Ig-like domain-containing protein [Chloroflexota bacterium]
MIALPTFTGIGRRSFVIRLAVALLAGFVAGFGLFFVSVSAPKPILATPASTPVPVTSAAVRTDLRVGLAPNAGVSIAFSSRMNPTSVAAALHVTPSEAVDLVWDGAGTLLTVRPLGTWALDTLHTITIEPGALAANGQPMPTAVRAAFLTRAATRATISATSKVGSRVGVDTAFELSFDHPVDATTLRSAVSIAPAVTGTLEVVGRRSGVRYRFVPTHSLAPNARYAISLAATARDSTGAAIAPATLAVRTSSAPGVVRFRPTDGASGVAADATLSVRFTEAMDVVSAKRAFSATANGKPITGAVSFVEGNTVLVFHPSHALPNNAKVVMTVANTAHAAAGARIGTATTATFKTASATPTTVRTPTPTTPPPTGGSAGNGPWAAVESYYLTLMNCTRTGGWVTSSGACSSPGGRNVAPLRLDAGISAKVSRPYAKLLATRNICSHFVGGNPGDRLRHAGYTSYVWAENLGCRAGSPMASVLGSHLFFQAEKSSLGGHYVNLMNAKYDRVGIGVWVYGGRVRLVIDFYHPL